MSYLSEVLSDSPLHYWRLADPGGNLAYDIGSNPKSLAVSASYLAMPYTGPASDGGSLWCNGGTVAWYLGSLNFTYPLTVECWYWQHYSLGNNERIFELNNAAGATPMLIRMNGGTTPAGYTTGPSVVAGVALADQTWHHLALVASAVETRLYVNGASAGVAAAITPGTTAAQVSIGGQRVTAAEPAHGQVAEAAVYTTALSAARILAHYGAADTRSSRPVSRLFGTLDTSTGSSALVAASPADLATIKDAVTRTYV